MYRTILLILYFLIISTAVTHIIRYRDVPSSRRLSAGLGVSGVLLAPALASILCELLVSVFSMGLLVIIILCGIAMILKSLFR